MKRFLAVLAVSALAIAGCSDGKPSTDAYVEALQERSKAELADDSPEPWQQYMNDYMLCVGESSHGNVSAEYIQAIIDNDSSYTVTDEERSAVEQASQECTAKVPMPNIKDDENPDVVDDAQWDDGTEEFEEDFDGGVGDVDEDGNPIDDDGATEETSEGAGSDSETNDAGDGN